MNSPDAHPAATSEFDAIRPYNDDEVVAVVARLVANEELRQTVARLVVPRLAAVAPRVARFCAGRLMHWRARSIRTVLDFQLQMGRYLDVVLRSSVDGLTHSGLDNLDPRQSYLFISNHRDIVLDSGMLDKIIHGVGFDTLQLAVGDNLFANAYAADVMRLNKGFMVERSVTGKKAMLAALTRTSRYVRHCLETGESVWIAQRGGRSKDGFDRTDPALLKMLSLAYRKEIAHLGELPGRMQIVPTAISYELDPSDALKARELEQLARDGSYQKSEGDDLMSIAAGVSGYKGRMHYHFGQPLTVQAEADGDAAQALAAVIDREIVHGLKLYPVNVQAARLLAQSPLPGRDDWLANLDLDALQPEPEGPATARFEQRINDCAPALRPWVLLQYANVLRNKLELADSAVTVAETDPVHSAAG